MPFKTVPAAKSISDTIAVITNVATSTIIVDCCSCAHVGQLTFSVNSLKDSLK